MKEPPELLICGINIADIDAFLSKNRSALCGAAKIDAFTAVALPSASGVSLHLARRPNTKFLVLTNGMGLPTKVMIEECGTLIDALLDRTPEVPILLDRNLHFLREGPLGSFVERNVDLEWPC